LIDKKVINVTALHTSTVRFVHSSFEPSPSIAASTDFLGHDQTGTRYYPHAVAYQPSIATFRRTRPIGFACVVAVAGCPYTPLCLSLWEGDTRATGAPRLFWVGALVKRALFENLGHHKACLAVSWSWMTRLRPIIYKGGDNQNSHIHAVTRCMLHEE